MQIREVAAALEAHDYPLTTAELAARHEHEVLDLPNGSERVSEVFTLFGDQTYADAEEARTTLLCGVGSGAIGRKHYSDRDPTPLGGTDHDHVSF